MVARKLGRPSLRALSHFDLSTRCAKADAGRAGTCSPVSHGQRPTRTHGAFRSKHLQPIERQIGIL